MKNLVFLSLLALSVLLAASVAAQEVDDDCVYAVDVDDEDMSNYTLCNSDSGINKILNSIVKGGSDGSTASEEFKAKAPVKKVDWLMDAKSLSERRFELLQSIAQECKTGFEVRAEKYIVGPNQGLDLEFSYRCND